MTDHHSYCRFCSALCGIVVTVARVNSAGEHSAGEHVVKVRGDPDHPVSRGYTCAKGRALGRWHHRPDRLEQPMVRRGDQLVETSWDECLDDLAARLHAIVDVAGPDAVGMFLGYQLGADASGRRVAERFLRSLGSRSKYTTTTIDMPCKLLVPELMTGHPYLVPQVDHDHATLVLIVGSNVVVSHGHFVMWPDPVQRIRALTTRGEVWVVDPRRTETARLATRHLAARPGTDHFLLAHLVREVLRDGADTEYVARHTSGVDRLAAAVEPFDASRVTDATGLAEDDLHALVAAIRRHGRLAAHTGTGVTMSPAANVAEWLTWALLAITGSLDRERGIWLNPGYLMRFDERANPAADGRADPGPPSRPDLVTRWGEYPCAALADEVEAGNLRALFAMGGNPVRALPGRARTERALAALDVLVVSDVVPTETTALATHVLPATGQLERADLTHFNDQFQPAIAAQYTPAVVAPVGARRPVWWQLAALGQRLGLEVLPGGLDPDACTDDDLLAPVAARGRQGFDHLRAHPSGVCDATAVYGWVTGSVLDADGWRLAPEELVAQLAALEAGPPPARLVLTPRRELRVMNSQLTEGGVHDDLSSERAILVHPHDAAAAGVADGTPVEVRSAHGATRGIASVTEDVVAGAVSVPHGFAEPSVARLTTGEESLDPLTSMVLQSGLPVELHPL